jgi:hypothetical protein
MKMLYFTRLFTAGNLKGIVQHDTVTFPTAERCVEWVKNVNALEKRNGYKVVDYSFQKFWRD